MSSGSLSVVIEEIVIDDQAVTLVTVWLRVKWGCFTKSWTSTDESIPRHRFDNVASRIPTCLAESAL